MLTQLQQSQQQGNSRETRKTIWIEHKEIKRGETELSVVSVEMISDIMPKEKVKQKKG